MANEAMSEERLRDVQSFYEDMPDSFMSKAYLGMMLSALREAQARAEKAEEAGYRRGIEAAIEIAQSQEGSHEQTGSPGEFGHDAACQHIESRLRELLPPDTQEKEKP